mmetsp:Transcript_14032/g.23215  ORF Transcript_14032/g.23215 Transcript_14032/m.23215 type:complete len:123 (-) Transcript_14032:1628-1996(-)
MECMVASVCALSQTFKTYIPSTTYSSSPPLHQTIDGEKRCCTRNPRRSCMIGLPIPISPAPLPKQAPVILVEGHIVCAMVFGQEAGPCLGTQARQVWGVFLLFVGRVLVTRLQAAEEEASHR